MVKLKTVSLLIGVNNQYRGQDIKIFENEFEKLLENAINLAGGDTTAVFVLSIPDYGVTPFAANSDKDKIAREIDQYNQIKKEIALKYDIPYFDITEISRSAANNTSLIADDDLHPSGKMYQLWVQKIMPDVKRILKN